MTREGASTELLDLLVLGTVEARAHGRRLNIGGPKQRSVLGVLTAFLGRRVSTDTIVDAIYGNDPPSGARRSVQTYVSNLRSELGDVITRQPNGYLLYTERHQIDATRFEDLAAGGFSLLPREPDQAAAALRDALALWRGHPYADVDGGTQLTAEVTRLTELRLSTLEARIEADLALGRHDQLVAELDALTIEHPHRERLRAHQMLALYRSGKPTAAVRAFDNASRTLAELGLEPSPELRELTGRILNHDQSIALHATPAIQQRTVLVLDLPRHVLNAHTRPADHVDVLTATDDVIHDSLARHAGEIFAQRLNTTFVVFAATTDAIAAISEIIRLSARVTDGVALVRAALDAGDVESGSDGSLQGPVITRAGGMVSMAHAGQVLLSASVHREASSLAGLTIRSLGDHAVRHSDQPHQIYQLVLPGLAADFPPLEIGSHPIAVPGGIRIVPGYELRSEVERGFGWVVWRAYQPSVGREVAVTVISSDLANEPAFVRRFELEALSIARLGHPHVVPIFDYWRDLSGAYLVEPWLGGASLADEIERDHWLTVDAASRLLIEIGSALEAAHRAGIAHGNMTPGAITVDEGGSFRLRGFGIPAVGESGRVRSTTKNDIVGLAATVTAAMGGEVRLPDRLAGLGVEARSMDSIGCLVGAWRTATMSTRSPDERLTPVRNPYVGLRAFTAADANDFYGRETMVTSLLSAVASQRFTALVGPSGVGKSSLVQAGLLPAILDGAVPGSERWFVTTMTPGSRPFESLASAILRVATAQIHDIEHGLRHGERGILRTAMRAVGDGNEILLVIDQFEEIFIHATEPEWDAFLHGLAVAVTDSGGNLRVVVTLRADFFDQPLTHPIFGEMLRSSTLPMSTPTSDELRDIVVKPAEGVGVAPEPGLVERILQEVGTEPGGLPLAEFALTQLFERRTSDVMTMADYDDLRGVLGALGRQAEATYAKLSPVEAATAKQLFLRLVTLPDGDRVVRRRLRVADVERAQGPPGAARRVLGAFGESRLLIFDRDPQSHAPTVEVAHEALFREWNRLAGWIADHRVDLVARRRLGEALLEWEASGRNEAMLLNGARLTHHLDWTSGTNLRLDASERTFLTESRRAEAARHGRAQRRRQGVLAGFAVAALVGVSLAALALGQWRSADASRQATQIAREQAETEADLARAAEMEAERAASVATSRRLAAQATAQVGEDTERSVLLALAAIDAGRDANVEVLEAVTALRKAIAAHRVVARYQGGSFVATSPDGSLMATGSPHGELIMHTLTTGGVAEGFSRPQATAIGAEFSPDGRWLAVVYAEANSPVWLWDLGSAEARPLPDGDFRHPDAEVTVSFDEVAARLAVSTDTGVVGVWDTATSELLFTTGVDGAAARLMPGSDELVVADPHTQTLQFLDAATGVERRVVDIALTPNSFAISADGRHAVVASQAELRVAMFDLASGDEIWRTTIDRPFGLEFLDDERSIAVGSDGGTISIIDRQSGDVVHAVKGGHAGSVWALASVPGQPQLASSGNTDGRTLIWDVSPGPRPEVAKLTTGANLLRFVDFAPYPDQLFVSDLDPPAARVLDAATLDVVFEIDQPQVGVTGVETRTVGGGSLVNAVTQDGSSELLDSVTGEVVYRADDGRFVRDVSPDGRFALVSGDPNGSELQGDAVIVDLASGDVTSTLAEPRLFLPSFSYDGRWVFSDAGDGTSLHLFDTTTGESAISWPLDEVFPVRPMPDGESIAMLTTDGTLWLADLGRLIDGHPIEIAALWSTFATEGFVAPLGLAASPDGSLIATVARRNEPVRFWDAATGDLVAEVDAQLVNGVPQVFFHPESSHVSVLSEGGVLLTFTLDTDELVNIARSRVTRSLSDAECRTFLDHDECPN